MEESSLLDDSLESWFALAPDATDMSYPFIRCAGLMRSLYALMGEDKALPGQQDLARDARSATDEFLLAALVVVGKGDVNSPEALQRVPRAIMAFAETYAGRFNRNLEATGTAFDGDEIVLSDLNLCKEVLGFARQRINNSSL